MKKTAYTITDFYCMKCGNRGISLPRYSKHRHEKFHRKDYYCPHCHETTGHIECHTDAEAYIFKENFAKGVYKDESEKEFVSSVRLPRLGEEHLGQKSEARSMVFS